MRANIIDGKILAQQVKDNVKNQVQVLQAEGIRPCLAVVLVGENAASAAYVRGKEKDCIACGIENRTVRLPEDTTEEELLMVVQDLAQDKSVHGILVQLPLPSQVDEDRVIAAIPPSKDVDGFTPESAGRLLIGEPCFAPCTPQGMIQMLKSTGVTLKGKNAVVLGRSNIVGKPAALLLLAEDCTVTICHSKTQNLKEICAQADILVAAVGRAGFVTGDMVKPGAIVIDVGINRNAEGKLCGDVDFEAAAERASWISPVPGGAGLMTRAMLLENTIRAARLQNGMDVLDV